jgi:lysyl-tRNA synthetase, class II
MTSDDADAHEEPSEEEVAVERASIRAQRIAKVAALRDEGTDPYPYRFDRDRTIGELREAYGALEAGAETDDVVRVAGRLMLKREQGRLTFG